MMADTLPRPIAKPTNVAIIDGNDPSPNGATAQPRMASRRAGASDVVLADPAHVWLVFAERCGQIDLMVLLLNEYLLDLFSHGELAEPFTLPNSLTVIPDGFVLVVEIEPKHFA